MRDLTGRQREVLAYFRAHVEAHAGAPSVREIAGRFSMTARGAFDHLRALERKGALVRRTTAGRVARPWSLPGAAAGRYRQVPILGRVAAGQPLMAEEHWEGTVPIEAGALPGAGDGLFALRVKGDSMIDAHICSGDLVLVRRQESADHGDVIVALLEGEATVKRLERRGSLMVLRPAHPTLEPIVVDPRTREVAILGKVVGLLRGL